MEQNDIVQSLIQFGLDKDKAIDLKVKLSAGDYLEIASALDSDDFGKSYLIVSTILKKYGIDLDKKIDEQNDTLMIFTDENDINNFIENIDSSGVKFNVDGKSSIKDSEMNEDKFDKKARDAKEKLADLKPRNPTVSAMVHKSGGGAHTNKKKVIDRKKKYKDKNFESANFEVGSKVKIGNETGVVEIAKGPNNTLGVNVNGEIKMVDKSEVEILNETSTLTNELEKIRKLAGIQTEAVLPAIEIQDEPVELEFDLEPVDISVDDSISGIEVSGEVLSSDELEVIPSEEIVEDSKSEAFACIEKCVADIHEKLSDVRVSEFKDVITLIGDLASSSRNLGRNFLGEGKE